MPATSPWYQGAAVPLAWISTDTTGTPFEAASPTLTVTLPDATTATPSITHNGSGSYSASLVTTQAGHHLVGVTLVDVGLVNGDERRDGRVGESAGLAYLFLGVGLPGLEEVLA